MNGLLELCKISYVICIVNVCTIMAATALKLIWGQWWGQCVVQNWWRKREQRTLWRCWDWRKQWFRWPRRMEWDGTGMCWGEMMGMFWEKRWSLNWRARGSEVNQRRRGKHKWRRRARGLVWRMNSWIERDGEWEGVGEIAVRVGLIWPPPFTGINPDQNWFDWLIDGTKTYEEVCIASIVFKSIFLY